MDVGPTEKQACITILPLASSKSFNIQVSIKYQIYPKHGMALFTSKVLMGLNEMPNKHLTHRKCPCAIAYVVRIVAIIIAIGNKSCRCRGSHIFGNS